VISSTALTNGWALTRAHPFLFENVTLKNRTCKTFADSFLNPFNPIL